MNNNRLSTYNSTKDIYILEETKTNIKSVLNLKNINSDNLSLKEKNKNKILLERINTLLNKPSNFEITSNGKIFIKSAFAPGRAGGRGEQKFFTLAPTFTA